MSTRLNINTEELGPTLESLPKIVQTVVGGLNCSLAEHLKDKVMSRHKNS